MSKFQTINSSGELDSIKVLPTLDLNFAALKTLDPRITFTRSSGGTYIDETGAIRIAGVNQPRFDHDPVTGECLGFLVERSATNYFLSSSNLTNTTYWSVDDCTISLAGSNNRGNFYRLYGTNSQGYRGLVSNFSTYSISVPLSSTVTFSLDAKVPDDETGSRQIQFTIIATSGNVGGFADATFATVSNTSSSGIDLGNGWRRYSATYTWMSSTTGAAFVKINPRFSSSQSVLIANLQLEVGSFLTSYIPTLTSTLTRAQDNASISGTAFDNFYNQSEGTIFSSYLYNTFNNSGLTNNPVVYHLKKASGSGWSEGIFHNNDGRLRWRDDGNPSVILSSFPFNQNYARVRSVFAYDNDKRYVTANGLSTVTQVSYTRNNVYGSLVIGRADAWSQYGPLNRPISRLIYWPKKLSNNDLLRLTE